MYVMFDDSETVRSICRRGSGPHLLGCQVEHDLLGVVLEHYHHRQHHHQDHDDDHHHLGRWVLVRRLWHLK